MAVFFAFLAFYSVPRIKRDGYKHIDYAFGYLSIKEKKKILWNATKEYVPCCLDSYPHLPRLAEEKYEKMLLVEVLNL
jgi:hypothetical protein